MSSPPPPAPGETPEQRQARFAAAAAVQNQLNQRARDEEARRAAAMYAALPQPVAAPSLAAKPAVNDPDFDINIAMNTFSKQLGERVRSGQMTVADAQRAQAQMRALQVNPAMANRAAATEIAQRALQVGPYHPSNIAAQQAAAQPVTNPVSDYIANMNAPAAEQKPDIVQMLGKYNLGAAPGTLGGTLGGIGLQSVGAPAPTTPPAALPPANPVNTDDFIPRNVRPPMTVMDTFNRLSKMNMGQAPVGMPQPMPQPGPQPGPPPMFQPGPPIQTTPMSQPMPQAAPVLGMYRGGFAVR